MSSTTRPGDDQFRSHFASVEAAFRVLPKRGWAGWNTHQFSTKNMQPAGIAEDCATHHEKIAIHGSHRCAHLLGKGFQLAHERGRAESGMIPESSRQTKVLAAQLDTHRR